MSGDQLRGGRFARRAVRHIERAQLTRAAGFLNERERLLRLGFVGAEVHRHMAAGLRERECDGASYAAAGAGDECDAFGH